jgi:hypothetical protein
LAPKLNEIIQLQAKTLFLVQLLFQPHKLRRAVSFANFGKLRFKTESDQQLWSECSRLITNCMIFYNATILSNLLLHKKSGGDHQGAALLSQVSPVAWQHINLHGRYQFNHQPESIDLHAIIQALAQVLVSLH